MRRSFATEEGMGYRGFLAAYSGCFVFPRRAAKGREDHADGFYAKGHQWPLRAAKPCGIKPWNPRKSWQQKTLQGNTPPQGFAALSGKNKHAARLRVPSWPFVVKNTPPYKASRPLAALRGKNKHAARLHVPSWPFVVKNTPPHKASRPLAALRGKKTSMPQGFAFLRCP